MAGKRGLKCPRFFYAIINRKEVICMVFAARLTQRGHKIATMDDLLALYEKSFSENTVEAIGNLPHPTVQKFAVITVAVVGASRQFLSQITRHQNEVKFMSASLQYSNYAGQADFAVPYEILTAPSMIRELYLKSCCEGMDCYEKLCSAGIGHDAGADVYMPYDCTFQPGEIAKVPLGFGIEVPDGYAGFVFPRTSMAVKGLVCELPPPCGFRLPWGNPCHYQ